MNQLLLMAGRVRRDGWTTLDANPAKGCDFTATIPPLPAVVTDQRWDVVEWSHGISSLYPWQAEELLPQLHGVLADGGVLILEQPHADVVFAAATEQPDFVGWVYGDPALRDPWHMNRWAYTPRTLARLLAVAGFRQVEQVQPARHPERDFRVEARA